MADLRYFNKTEKQIREEEDKRLSLVMTIYNNYSSWQIKRMLKGFINSQKK